MTKRILFVLAAVLTLGMVSCSNDNEPNVDKNLPAKDVTIRIGGMQTRAAGEAIGTKAAILNDGYVVFASSGGQIVQVVPFGGSATITASDLTGTNGHKFTNVPGTVNKVYVYGNIPSDLTLPTSGALESINALLANVGSQADATEGVDRVTLYGGDAITGTAPDYAATFDIKPIAARIEIKDVVVKSGSTITSFNVEGIFINNYYEAGRLDGKLSGTPVNKGQGGDAIYKEGVAPYVAGFPLFDFNTSGLTKEADKVWAYNVLAPSDNTTEHTHVIIRLSNIAPAGAFKGTQFVTIKAFNDGTNTLTHLTAGKVYELGSIEISQEHLSPEAETEAVNVTVTANVVDWVPVPVTPEM